MPEPVLLCCHHRCLLFLAAWLALLAAACQPVVPASPALGTKASPSHKPEPALSEHIAVTPDGLGFQLAESGRPFRPVGVSYDHDSDGRLLEDYWQDDWPRVAEDLQEIARLGFNTVRIHLQLNRFMTSPRAVNTGAFARLDKLVRRARELGLYVDLTGLGHYRKADIPRWFAELSDEAMTAAEALLWRHIARRFAAEPAVFCYDLQNEPIIAWQSTQEVVGPPFVGVDGTYHFINLHDRDVGRHWTAWLHRRYGDSAALARVWPDFPRPGESFAAIALPGMLDRERNRSYHAFLAERARRWTAALVAAIREHDRRHLITIGSLPGALPFLDSHYSSFSPHNLGDLLDFVSLHLHVWGQTQEDDAVTAEMLLRAAHVGKPVLVEELSVLLPAAATRRFIDRSRHSAAGFLGYYWGRTPAQLRAGRDGSPPTLHAEVTAGQIELLASLGQQLRGRPYRRRPGDVILTESVVELRLSGERRRALRERFAAEVAAGRYVDIRLEP